MIQPHDVTLSELQNMVALPDSNFTWPDLQPLEGNLKPVQPFNVDWLPEALRDYTLDVAHRMQVPLDYVAVGLLISIATVIGARCAIRPKAEDDWSVVPNLWGGIVGRPSELKTPTLAEATSFVYNLQRTQYQAYDEASAEYERESKFFEMEYKALEKNLADAYKARVKNSGKAVDIEGLQHQLNNLPAPTKPILRRYITNDSTVEKIAELLTENPRGMLVQTDELIALFSSFDKQGRESDRAFYLQGWNGDSSYTADRVSRGTIKVDCLCINLIGTIQPAKLNQYILQAYSMTANDGLIQRLQLLVYPDKVSNWHYTDQQPNYAAKERVQAIFEKLDQDSFIRSAAMSDSNSRFAYYRFDSEAQAVFTKWFTDLRQRIVQIEQHGETLPLAEHLSKYASLMPTLALLLHLIQTAADDTPYHFVSAEDAKRAVQLCDYLESHAERVYDVSSLRKQGALRLAKMLQKGKLASGFNCRDVYRKGWYLLKTPQEAEQAIDELVDKGWLVEDFNNLQQIQRGGASYLINPAVLDN
ncbi:MAG: DUF3987 domain-containing protein [Gammaproteobacteria bacterium]|nr:DUF3987 domain-containing protein [Gammaproteobacteria bacterium]